MSEEKKKIPATNIQWLCRNCYEHYRDIPREHQPNKKKYRIWETGRWQKDGMCACCRDWKLLTLYEWEDAEKKEERARIQAYREHGYVRKKDTRARYRDREEDL